MQDLIIILLYTTFALAFGLIGTIICYLIVALLS